MSKILCGECCRKKVSSMFLEDSLEERAKKTLEFRKSMSLKLEWYKIFVCSDCKIYMYISSEGFIKTGNYSYVSALCELDLEKEEQLKLFI